mmetsp:Transcript_15721/g.28128  ORF Transcript_15721/g.28128 Transcript_15721/m.28128 type:complete len:303 (-) Transcript_15721:1601-2509(-)
MEEEGEGGSSDSCAISSGCWGWSCGGGLRFVASLSTAGVSLSLSLSLSLCSPSSAEAVATPLLSSPLDAASPRTAGGAGVEAGGWSPIRSGSLGFVRVGGSIKAIYGSFLRDSASSMTDEKSTLLFTIATLVLDELPLKTRANFENKTLIPFFFFFFTESIVISWDEEPDGETGSDDGESVASSRVTIGFTAPLDELLLLLPDEGGGILLIDEVLEVLLLKVLLKFPPETTTLLGLVVLLMLTAPVGLRLGGSTEGGEIAPLALTGAIRPVPGLLKRATSGRDVDLWEMSGATLPWASAAAA